VRPLGPGARIGAGLEVIAHLARSNPIDVYDAWSELRGCRVAVKALRPDRLRDRDARAALLREGRLLAHLTHPHLVRAYEVREGDRPVVVLETLRGLPLPALIADRPLGSAEAAQLGLQVGSALRYLNGEGLVHLDVKPSNVIAHAGAAKLIDLSFTRRPGLVDAGLGSSHNLSPEQARGGFAGPAADVWGLGTILYEALAGAPPFGEANGGHPSLDRRADPLRRHRPGAPRALAEAVDATLEPDQLARPEIEELLAVLDAHAGHPAGPGRWP
jgi:serine/threonine protein kinase